MIESTDNYALDYSINYQTHAIDSSVPAVAGLLTYAITIPISTTTMEWVHTVIDKAETS